MHGNRDRESALKDIYSRLAVENRATAAVMISELLVGA
jgi:hypothetical protein